MLTGIYKVDVLGFIQLSSFKGVPGPSHPCGLVAR